MFGCAYVFPLPSFLLLSIHIQVPPYLQVSTYLYVTHTRAYTYHLSVPRANLVTVGRCRELQTASVLPIPFPSSRSSLHVTRTTPMQMRTPPLSRGVRGISEDEWVQKADVGEKKGGQASTEAPTAIVQRRGWPYLQVTLLLGSVPLRKP